MSKDLSILIVEDEAMLALLLQLNLKKSGYQVLKPVSTGEDAISSALLNKPDVILMDIRLAGEMDGIESARQISEHIDTAIVFMTGYSDPGMRAQAELLDPVAFLVKPVTPDQLVPVLDLISNG